MATFTLTVQVGLEDPQIISTFSSIEDACEDLIQAYAEKVTEIEDTIFECHSYSHVFDCDGQRYDSSQALIAAKMANVTFSITIEP
jgi:hypothetical protein